MAPGSCWHTAGAGVEGFASSADRPAWRGGHSTTAGGVLRPTYRRKRARQGERERKVLSELSWIFGVKAPWLCPVSRRGLPLG